MARAWGKEPRELSEDAEHRPCRTTQETGVLTPIQRLNGVTDWEQPPGTPGNWSETQKSLRTHSREGSQIQEAKDSPAIASWNSQMQQAQGPEGGGMGGPAQHLRHISPARLHGPFGFCAALLNPLLGTVGSLPSLYSFTCMNDTVLLTVFS